MGVKEFIEEVRGILGDRVFTEGEVIERYSRDWWPLAILLEKMGLWGYRARAVLFPENAGEVSVIVKLAGKHSVCLIPYGGGSSVTGASTPRGDCVVMSLSKLNRIIDFNEEDLLLTVEAGALLKDIEPWLNGRGYTLRYIPQSFDITSIGGSIASSGVGQYTTGYGGIEDVVVNLEVVLPSGEIIWTRSVTVPRSAMGPDLKALFIGSEGSLGIITKAVLRVIPKPGYSMRGAFIVPSFIEGLTIVKKLLLKGYKPAIPRLSDEVESALRFNSGKPVLLLEYEGWDDDIISMLWSKAVEQVKLGGGIYIGEELYVKWLEQRFNYVKDMQLLEELGLWFETIDIAASWSKLSKVYESMREALEKYSEVTVMCHASHFYMTGAALYFTIIYRRDPDLYWRIVSTSLRKASENGATLSHHHGIGLLRSQWINIDPGPSHMVIERIKKALDPGSTLKPLW